MKSRLSISLFVFLVLSTLLAKAGDNDNPNNGTGKPKKSNVIAFSTARRNKPLPPTSILESVRAAFTQTHENYIARVAELDSYQHAVLLAAYR